MSKSKTPIPHTASKQASGSAAAPAIAAAHAPTPGVSHEYLGSSRAQPPRVGSKQARVVDLLARADGASIDELMGATGWLAHTTRAALTGLRKRGFAIDREVGEEGRSVYRIARLAPEPKPIPKRRAGRGRSAEGTAVTTA